MFLFKILSLFFLSLFQTLLQFKFHDNNEGGGGKEKKPTIN